MQQSVHNVASEQAVLEQQRTVLVLAAQELKRALFLFPKGFETRQVVDQRQQAVNAALAGFQSAQAKTDAGMTTVDAARRTAGMAEVNIADNTLVPPKDGRVQYRLANVGQVLPAGCKVFTTLDTGYVYMDVYLPTGEAGRVAADTEARIVLGAWPTRPLSARVMFVDPQNQFTRQGGRDQVRARQTDVSRAGQDRRRHPSRKRRQGAVGPAGARLRQDRPGRHMAADLAGGERRLTMTGSVASVSGLRQRYGRVVTLDIPALDIPAACLVGLLGPDGVGKSTLLDIVAGARQAQSGWIDVLGGDMRRAAHRRAVCARIAYMPQGLGKNLYPDLSVRENIEFFARLFGWSAAERAARIPPLVARTGLTPFLDRPAKKLSGGMRQKLGLCCALVHDPDLLILDEPTTGVDPLSRRQFWELIARMRRDQPAMSVLVATAYMDEAERFDHLIAMHAGRVLAAGSPAALKAQTGTHSIEDAFVALLPAAMRDGRTGLVIPPRHAETGAPAIVAHGLTRRFGDFTAVDHVDFSIGVGEIFGFLGSNGCGKSTTMKMLTGLLPASEGQAWILGQASDASDIAMRDRVGYMSQSFSLSGELTVRQNLVLHTRLYHIPPAEAATRIDDLVRRFGLADSLDQAAASLPLGIRQRLSLAVAVVHRPELLILDEPTSGVDPLARDAFWALLVDMSRNQGVTIFISTHFMNEAARCDRVALMHAGRVLATGTPAALVAERHADDLQDALIQYIERAEPPVVERSLALPHVRARASAPGAFSLRRLGAYAIREALELRRDPVRLAFAVLGAAFLMVVMGFGTNTDVDHVAFATLDREPEGRAYADAFRASSYFDQRSSIRDTPALEQRLATGELRVAIDIPAGFGRNLRRDRAAEVGVWVDGAAPFQGETARGYVMGAHATFLGEMAAQDGTVAGPSLARIEPRLRYNQAFDSANAMVPGTLAFVLALIPGILMAVAVVREKELGSITNLYVTPVTRLEFILGKQLPYVAVSLVSAVLLVLIAVFLFDVPLRGSPLALGVGVVIYVSATTA